MPLISSWAQKVFTYTRDELSTNAVSSHISIFARKMLSETSQCKVALATSNGMEYVYGSCSQ
jgi:hypothetical protein